MGMTLVTAPAGEPVTLATAKLHCNVDADITSDDALIQELIIAARKQAEHRTGRALITQQWQKTLDAFTAQIELPRPKLQSVESVTYLDTSGVRQTLPAADYQIVSSDLVGRIIPAYGKQWPSHRAQPDSIQINYTCGYGNAAAVPEDVKLWIKMAVSTLYGQREGMITGVSVAEVPRNFFAALLDSAYVPGV